MSIFTTIFRLFRATPAPITTPTPTNTSSTTEDAAFIASFIMVDQNIKEEAMTIATFTQDEVATRCATIATLTYSDLAANQEAADEGTKVVIFETALSTVVVRAKGAAINLAYKGTSSLQDLATDFSFLPVFGSDLLPEGQGYIHGGFLAAFKSTWPQVEAFLTTYAATQGLTVGDLNYVSCGHSLGGAQATLASLQLALLVKRPAEQLRQVTFGSPRSLSHAAADYFGRIMGGRTLRVAENNVDIVTMVAPGFLGFKHVGVNLAVRKPDGVLPHLMEGYTHGASSLTALTFTPTYALGARRAFFLAVRQLVGLF